MQEQHTNTLVQQVLDLDVRTLETADACAEQLKVAAGEANKMAASAVGYGQMAIRYAIKAGEIMNRAKDILPHGEFLQWIAKCCDVSEHTVRRWMRLANQSRLSDLLASPDIKSITDAYRATGILPEPEPKPITEGGTGEADRVKLAWSPIKFSTRIDDWTKEQALDWLYEYDRMSQWARQLRMEFSLK